jgi:cytochrome c556
MALRTLLTTLAFAAGLSLTAGAIAHDGMAKGPNTPGAKAAHARHANFKALGAASKTVNDELKKDSPDIKLIAANANKMKALTTNIPSWFPKGSGPESKAETAAKPEIWSDAAGFAAAANRVQVETSKLALLANAGDLAGVKGQVRNVGGACKNCHDKFRVPEKK